MPLPICLRRGEGRIKEINQKIWRRSRMEYSDAGGNVRATGIKLLRCAWKDGLNIWELFTCGNSSGEFCLLLSVGFQFGSLQYLLVNCKWSKTDDFKGVTEDSAIELL
jgi:hypothetical protein